MSSTTTAHLLAVLLAAGAGVGGGWVAVRFARFETGRDPAYPATVAAAAGVAGWAALVVPANFLLPATLLLGWALLSLSLVDILDFRLPDIVTIPLIAGGLLLSFWLPDRDPLGHLIGAVAGFAVLYAIAVLYRRARAREGLGLGDAKLAAAAGAWLGWQALPSVVLVGCLVAFIWVGVGIAFRGRVVLETKIAFGVPLSFAIWVIWLYGAPF
jgi:leader peptidase (prepilin peptidase)/N-methyltransferase